MDTKNIIRSLLSILSLLSAILMTTYALIGLIFHSIGGIFYAVASILLAVYCCPKQKKGVLVPAAILSVAGGNVVNILLHGADPMIGLLAALFTVLTALSLLGGDRFPLFQGKIINSKTLLIASTVSVILSAPINAVAMAGFWVALIILIFKYPAAVGGMRYVSKSPQKAPLLKKKQPTPAAPVPDAADQLSNLKTLYDRGLITEEAYQKARQEIIDKL